MVGRCVCAKMGWVETSKIKTKKIDRMYDVWNMILDFVAAPQEHEQPRKAGDHCMESMVTDVTRLSFLRGSLIIHTRAYRPIKRLRTKNGKTEKRQTEKR